MWMYRNTLGGYGEQRRNTSSSSLHEVLPSTIPLHAFTNKYMIRYAYERLIAKPEGERPVWTPRPMWEDNIKTDL